MKIKPRPSAAALNNLRYETNEDNVQCYPTGEHEQESNEVNHKRFRIIKDNVKKFSHRSHLQSCIEGVSQRLIQDVDSPLNFTFHWFFQYIFIGDLICLDNIVGIYKNIDPGGFLGAFQ